MQPCRLQDAPSAGPVLRPRAGALTALAVAAGVPFIAFGFTDNFIMLIAGEEIDATFGERLGLSTLAAAGLGNLVSDVAGLALAERLEVRRCVAVQLARDMARV